MPASPLLYYITDRKAFADDEPTRRRLLLAKISEAAQAGVDYIQLREKDLHTRDLESLAREAARILAETKRKNGRRTALLINSRTDVALAAQADGVHLLSDDVSPQDAALIWKRGASALARDVSPQATLIVVSCHTPEEVMRAQANGATFAVFAPVFEKKDRPGASPKGLSLLEKACAQGIPVLALGGVTLANVRSCLEAGAAGIAAIRIFQENDVAELVHRFLHVV